MPISAIRPHPLPNADQLLAALLAATRARTLAWMRPKKQGLYTCKFQGGSYTLFDFASAGVRHRSASFLLRDAQGREARLAPAEWDTLLAAIEGREPLPAPDPEPETPAMASEELQQAIQERLNQNADLPSIRAETPNIPFVEWARVFLRCSRRCAVVLPWSEGTGHEEFLIAQMLRRIALDEGIQEAQTIVNDLIRESKDAPEQ